MAALVFVPGVNLFVLVGYALVASMFIQLLPADFIFAIEVLLAVFNTIVSFGGMGPWAALASGPNTSAIAFVAPLLEWMSKLPVYIKLVMAAAQFYLIWVGWYMNKEGLTLAGAISRTFEVIGDVAGAVAGGVAYVAGEVAGGLVDGLLDSRGGSLLLFGGLALGAYWLLSGSKQTGVTVVERESTSPEGEYAYA